MMQNNSEYNIICFGELLWDILPSGAQPGGAPMNVAYHLTRLGENSALISRVGADQKGKDLMEVLKMKGIATGFIQSDPETTTGIVHGEPDEHGEMAYEIVAPAAWDYIRMNQNVLELVKNTACFVFGSLSARNKTTRETLFSLLENAHRKVLDINLRPPFYDQQLIEALLQKADLVKLNLAELELISGWYGSMQDRSDRITLLQDRFHIPSLIVTLGAEGAMVNWEGKLHHHPGYRVQVADTVGSGDSFLAAFLHKTIRGAAPEKALAYAAALGALVASKEGACPEYGLEEIERMMR